MPRAPPKFGPVLVLSMTHLLQYTINSDLSSETPARQVPNESFSQETDRNTTVDIDEEACNENFHIQLEKVKN